ncbi:hypothetical protein [Demequina mangrovi]|uniref:Uncharacterized protein n=1 Tax=Demequina mangrovi TaxID=1043493 RepID=A0A1H6WRY2_9MICO|nr:hypothetical protein [Demequina mangrovi]SEJ15212.1 hypothetical protein SAMN05421637_0964 [Demequina mangrovi]
MRKRRAHAEAMADALVRIRATAAGYRREDGVPPVIVAMPRSASAAVAAARASRIDLATTVARAVSGAPDVVLRGASARSAVVLGTASPLPRQVTR